MTCLLVGLACSAASAQTTMNRPSRPPRSRPAKPKNWTTTACVSCATTAISCAPSWTGCGWKPRFERRGSAEDLDPRYLRLQEMAAAIAAARDTVDHQGAELERRQLMAERVGVA